MDREGISVQESGPFSSRWKWLTISGTVEDTDQCHSWPDGYPWPLCLDLRATWARSVSGRYQRCCVRHGRVRTRVVIECSQSRYPLLIKLSLKLERRSNFVSKQPLLTNLNSKLNRRSNFVSKPENLSFSVFTLIFFICWKEVVFRRLGALIPSVRTLIPGVRALISSVRALIPSVRVRWSYLRLAESPPTPATLCGVCLSVIPPWHNTQSFWEICSGLQTAEGCFTFATRGVRNVFLFVLCIMWLLVYDMLVNVNGMYYVHVCEQARWARSAGNSAI